MRDLLKTQKKGGETHSLVPAQRMTEALVRTVMPPCSTMRYWPESYWDRRRMASRAWMLVWRSCACWLERDGTSAEPVSAAWRRIQGTWFHQGRNSRARLGGRRALYLSAART